MFEDAVPRNEVALRILKATDTLMAKNGVQYLSTHKIAKEAGVSVGTIYLYFKDKDTLLNQLVIYLFEMFHQAIDAKYDPSLSLFEQYQRLWQAKWEFMLDNPTVVKNMHQYESLPQFQTVLRECLNSEFTSWNKFIMKGKSEGVIVELPSEILFSMSLGIAWQVMYHQLLISTPYSQALLDEIIQRTWNAILV